MGRQIKSLSLVLRRCKKLYKFENVHHKNGNKSDNKLSNLELWACYQPYGQRVSNLVKFVKKYYIKEK